MRAIYFLASFAALVAALPSVKPKPRPRPKPLPLLIWHGLGDRFDADGLRSTGELAEEVHPGTYVYYIRTDEDGGSDRSNTFFGNVTTQLAEVCAAIHEDAGLADPDDITKVRADALGFSQGGQFLRGLIETCEGLSVRSLVTFGSQHNGISEFQDCDTFDFVCKGATGLIVNNVWTDFIQGKVVPAQYYRQVNETTGLGSDEYLKHSNFLAHINNEKKVKVEMYKEKIAALEKFAMYVFKDDETVVPKETGWFAEVNITSGEVTPLRERLIYKEDWLGLKKLDKKGGLVFRNTTGKHMELSDKDLRDAFTEYFGPERDDKDALQDDEDFLGFQDYKKALWHAAIAGDDNDHAEARKWLDKANEIMDEMRAAGYQEKSVDDSQVVVVDVDDDFDDIIDDVILLNCAGPESDCSPDDEDLSGHQELREALRHSLQADGDEKSFWQQKANRMLYEMRAAGYQEKYYDADRIELEDEGWVPLGPVSECGHDRAQTDWDTFWNSMSWWEKRKWEWETYWLPWFRGELTWLGDAKTKDGDDL